MKYMLWIASIFSILSIVYTILLVVYAGSSVSYLWLWPVAAVVFAWIAIGGFYSICKKIVVMQYIIKGTFALMLSAGVFLIAIACMLWIKGKQPIEGKPEYILVLGAQVKGTKVSKALRARLDCAAKYAQDHTESRVIVSGGQGDGEDITEAEAMRLYLENQKKISSERIQKEDKSKNTEQNIEYSIQQVKRKEAGIIIVSNRFHIYRAIAIAEKKGIKPVYGLGAPTDSVMCIHYYLRESLAVIKYKFSGVI